MGKYRHKITGRVSDLRDSYAALFDNFEPVSEDTAEVGSPSVDHVPSGEEHVVPATEPTTNTQE